MKLACTTLACPSWSLETILQKFPQYGYEGLDFRGLGSEMEIWKLPEFTTDLAATVAKVKAAGLVVSAFSSSARMYAAAPAERAKHLEEVRQYVRLCRAFGCGLIRVFGGPLQGAGLEAALPVAEEAVEAMAKAAAPDVTIAVETHDDWIRSSMLAAVMKRVKARNVGLLWDLHHPYRMIGESPRTTYENIGKWIVATHVKDSLPASEGKYSYTLGGQGDVPLAEMIGLLKKGGYQGYVTLEWEKRWIPTLPEPDVALPQYAQWLGKLI